MTGTLHLPTSPEQAVMEASGNCVLPDTLTIASIFITILLLRRFVEVIPSIMACAIRWKESVNLEASVKLSIDRNLMAAGMFIPFCLVAAEYRLYAPSFTNDFDNTEVLGVTAGISVIYILFRKASSLLFRPNKMNRKTYTTGDKASYTFFILLTLSLLTVSGITHLTGLPFASARNAMLWVSAITYAVFIIRKTQIFASSCSVFTAFLYLCALEFIPTGTLIVSALIF